MNVKINKQWLLVMNASIASYLDASLLVTTGIVLAIWKEHFGFSPWLVGTVSTTLTVAVALGSLVGGYLSDKLGKIKIFNLDILFVAIGTLTVAMAVNTYMLLIGLFIAGLASGADLPTSLSVISERTPVSEHGKIIASTELFWVAGIIISQGLGFLTARAGYVGVQVLFIWLACVSGITWIIRVFSKSFQRIERNTLLENGEMESTSIQDRKLRLSQILRMKRYVVPLLGLTGFYLFWNLPANTWGSFLNYFIVTVDGKSQQFSTLVGFTANIIGVFVLFEIYMKLADTKYRYVMMRVGMVMCILSLVFSAIYGEHWLIFTIAYFVYCSASLLNGEPIYKIWSQSLYPAHVRASVTGLTYAIVRAITAIFSQVTPVIMGYSPKLLIGLLAVSMVLAWTFAELIIHFIKAKGIEDPVFNRVH